MVNPRDVLRHNDSAAEAVRQAKAARDDGEVAPPEEPAVEALVSDRWLAYSICVLVTWNLFCNHWSRDSVGALELPLEEPPFALSVRQYNSLSAAYFAPNVPVPIVAGMLAQSYGPAVVYVGFAATAFAGNVLMSAACAAPHYPLLLAGRVLTGFAYEARPATSAHTLYFTMRCLGLLLANLLTTHSRRSTSYRSACLRRASRRRGRCWLASSTA